MNTEAQKMRFERIDSSFVELKKNFRNPQAIDTIEKSLSEIFNQTFAIKIVETKRTDTCFVMSVFPEISTIERIVDSIVKEESTTVVNELWAKNTSWIIEIDRRVLDDTIAPMSARECTALLMHEIGHVVNNNSVPERISRVVKFEYAKFGTGLKEIFKSGNFKSILSLPVMDACTLSTNMQKESIKREIKADQFSYKMGYGQELESALNKFISSSNLSADESVRKVTQFSADMVENFQKRRVNVNRRNLHTLLATTPSDYVKTQFIKIKHEFMEGSDETSVTDEKMMEMVCDRANEAANHYYTEFFTHKKKLKKLDAFDIDYCQSQIDQIATYNDKLLIISYIRSRIDIAQYYLDILTSDKYAKKYEVPHTTDYVTAYKTKMEMLLDLACRKKVEVINKRPGIYVNYPEGYEG